jgi:hypothetical protein
MSGTTESLPYAVVRLDDNGHWFLVSRHGSRQDAEALADAFAAKGHRQSYEVRSVEELGDVVL